MAVRGMAVYRFPLHVCGDVMVAEENSWYIFNDFLVEKTILEDALGFLPQWKEPCILLYRDEKEPGGYM